MCVFVFFNLELISSPRLHFKIHFVFIFIMESLKNLLNGEKINYDYWLLTHIALSFVDPEKDELVLAFCLE